MNAMVLMTLTTLAIVLYIGVRIICADIQEAKLKWQVLDLVLSDMGCFSVHYHDHKAREGIVAVLRYIDNNAHQYYVVFDVNNTIELMEYCCDGFTLISKASITSNEKLYDKLCQLKAKLINEGK